LNDRRGFPIWPCSRWGLPCRRVLPPTRCALTAPFHPCRSREGLGRSALCCTFRGLTPPRRYLAPDPPEPGLSSAPAIAGGGSDCPADSREPRYGPARVGDRKSTRLNSSHVEISYAVFCLKKKKNEKPELTLWNRKREKHSSHKQCCCMNQTRHYQI